MGCTDKMLSGIQCFLTKRMWGFSSRVKRVCLALSTPKGEAEDVLPTVDVAGVARDTVAWQRLAGERFMQG